MIFADDPRFASEGIHVQCAISGKPVRLTDAIRAQMTGMPDMFLHPDVVRAYTGREDALQRRLQDVVLGIAAPHANGAGS